MYYVNSHLKKVGKHVSKHDFRARKSQRKRGNYIMIKGSRLQENRAILSVHVH